MLPSAMESERVKGLQRMGFDTSKIRHCVKRKLKRSSKAQKTIAELVEDLAGDIFSSLNEKESQSTPLHPVMRNEVLSRSNTSSPTASCLMLFQTASLSSMESRMQELKEERQCKVCLDKESDIVFVLADTQFV